MAEPRVSEVPIFTYYNKQRFEQFGSMDCANWYQVPIPDTKRGLALYPAMGRKHIEILGQAKLAFDTEPRVLFKSIDYAYTVVNTTVYQIDELFNITPLGTVSSTGDIWFDYLRIFDTTYCMMTDGTDVYIITEKPSGSTFETVTDGHRPTRPNFVVAFGNRFVVSNTNSSQYWVTATNLGGVSEGFSVNLGDVFTVNSAALFNLATGTVRQLATLHNQLYIFTDYSCDVWNNIPTQVSVSGSTRTFPFRLNNSYNWDYGMEDPFSLSVDFGRMCWLGKNQNGFVSFMVSDGGPPQVISSQAIDVLLQGSRSGTGDQSPFLREKATGFLYEYENNIFYRASAGTVEQFGSVTRESSVSCIEYNFNAGKWARCIELDGQRNKIEKHVFFKDRHLVTVQNDGTIYQMAGDIYYNEDRNASVSNPNDDDAFTKVPMRYELATSQIIEPDEAEFMTQWLQIDFVFGDRTFYKWDGPFKNAVYIVAEDAAADGSPIYLTDEDGAFLLDSEGNTPQFDDDTYYKLFKPHIELFYSDDGGVSFLTADVREFSQLGQYKWRMRWYQLGVSRNRVYKLRCVSSAPIVVLGATQMTKRTSGGAV